MLNRKKIQILATTVISIFLFIVLLNNKAIATTEVDEKIHSRFIIDTKTMVVDQKNFIVSLNNDYIYVLDNLGKFVKRLDVFEDEYFISSYREINPEFDPTNISLEIIDDIDGKGYQDVLVIIKEYSFENIIAISYEDNEVIWQVTPSMESSKICGFNSYCQENVPITNYEISSGNLFVSSGYQLEEIDIKTGEIIKNYTYENNIWDFAIVSDINNDTIRDIYIAVQPTLVISIDGKTFKKIDDLVVAKEARVSFRNYKILLNVWSLEYLPNRDLLIAGSEDGFVYEIDPKKNEITNSIKFFNIRTFFYGNIIDGKGSNIYESYYENDVENIYFGKASYKQSFIKINRINSIDNDELDDYIVEFLPGGQRNTTFTTCSSEENSCDLDSLAYERSILYINDTYVVYRKPDGYTLVKDLKSDTMLITPCDSEFNNGEEFDEFTECSDISVYSVDDGFLVNKDNGFIYKMNFNRTNDEFEWNISFVTYQEHVEVLDHLIIFDCILDGKTGFIITNKDREKIISYKAESKFIIDYKISKQYLYIIERDELDNYIYKVFDIITGNLLLDHNSNEILKDFAEIGTILNQDIELYNKYGDDNIDSLLIKMHYENTSSQLKEFVYLIYDISTNTIVDSITFDNIPDLKNQVVYPDINQDGTSEILTYHYDSELEKTNFKIYLSNDEDCISENLIKEKVIDANLSFHKIKFVSDLNNDGYYEVILDHDFEVKKLPSYVENKAFIIDFKDESENFMTYENSNGENLVFNILSIEDDVNNDNLKEIIILETDDIESSLDHYPAKMKIINYANNEIQTKFEYSIFTNINVSKLKYPTNLISFIDLDEDDIKEIAMFSTDYKDQILIEIFSFSNSMVPIKSYSYNVEKDIENIKLNPGTTIYQNIDLVEFKDNYYFRVNPTGRYGYISVFLNAKTFEIWNYTGKNYVGVYNNQFIFENENNRTLQLVNPMSHDDIEVKVTGIFKNIYNFNIKRDVEIKSIKIYYQRMFYTKFLNQNFKVNLPESDYDLFFLVETKEGGIFYYHDIFVIKNNFGQTFLHIGALIGISIGLFYTTHKLILKHYLLR